MAKIFANPTVTVNNVPVVPKPNSTSIVEGKGEKTVKGVSAGAGFSDIVISEDISTKISKIKFSIPSNDVNYSLVRAWQAIDLNLGNVVTVHEDDYAAVMTGGIVINDPEKMFGVDEYFEVEFHGRPIV